MFFLATFLCLSAVLLIFMVKEAFENNIVHHEIPLKGEEEKYTLFFISDIHTRKISDKMIQHIEQPIHAVIIGGDLADRRTPIETIYRNIQLLQTLGPIFFIWGNNDREVGEERLRKIFKELGVTVIENDAVLFPNMKNRCWLSAVDDVSSRKSNPEQAFNKCNREDAVIFVSHNPQLFTTIKNKYDANVYLAGHLHGGQIRLGPFGLYQQGSLSVEDGKFTLISNGYGTTLVPLRLGAKPECHIIDLIFRRELRTNL